MPRTLLHRHSLCSTVRRGHDPGSDPRTGPAQTCKQLPSRGRGAPTGAEITPVEPDPGHAGEGRLVEMETPNWGITPVPERLRVLGTFDTTLLWTNLGVSLLVLVLPAYFDLSLK